MTTYKPCNRMIKSIIITLVLLAGPGIQVLITAQENKGRLVLEISNLRSNSGKVLVSVYNSADRFMKDPAQDAYATYTTAARNGSVSIVMDGLPEGDYGIAVMHDENGNQKMDKNAVGIPKEGFGFSNDAKVRFGPPGFNAARIRIGNRPVNHKIRMRYF